MAFAFGVSPAAFSQQRAVTRPVQRYGQAPAGPLASRMPQRVGGSVPANPVTPVGAPSPYRNPSASAGTSFTGGYVYDSDTPANMDPRTAAWIGRTMQSNKAAGSGPYDMAYGRFGALPSPQQHVEQQIPVGTQYAGGSTVRGRADGGTALAGPISNPEADRIGALNAQGRHLAYRSSGPPRGGLTPEMESRRQAAITKYDQRDQMMAANRNITANRRYGAPLRPDLFPGAQQAYAQQAPGAMGAPSQPNQTVADAYSRNTVANEDGSTSTDWGRVAMTVFDDPKFKNDPQAAFEELRRQGFTSDDLAALHSQRRGLFGIRFGENEPFIDWLGRMQSGVAQQDAGKTAGPIQNPDAVLGAPKVQGPFGQYSPPLPPDSQVVAPPSQQFYPRNIGNPDTYYAPPPQTPSAPPATPPRRRGGVPAFRPNF